MRRVRGKGAVYRASVAPVSSETEAQLEGAKNLYRYNRGDLFNVSVWIGFCLVVAGVCWVVLHAVFLVTPVPEPHLCQTVAQCNREILAHPLHVKPMPGFPQFHGP